MGAEIAKTDISQLDETAVTPVRVETVVKLTSESSLEQIPQIVLGKYKTLNLLPFASKADEEESDFDDDELDDAEKEEIAKRKVESEKQKKEKDEILAMQKQYHSLHGQHVNSKQHMVILSGDDSELSPLPPERTENEKENEGHLKASSSLYHLDETGQCNNEMITKQKKEMQDHMIHLLTSHAQQSDNNQSSSAGP